MFNNAADQFGGQQYIGLFNNTVGSIASEPLSVIVSDFDNNVVSTNNINPYIDDLTINVNKINATGINSTAFLRGDSTWVDISTTSISGSAIPLISILVGTGALGVTKLYTWVLDDTIMNGSLVITLTGFTTDATGNFVFNLTNPYPFLDLSTRYIACSMSCTVYDSSTPKSYYCAAQANSPNIIFRLQLNAPTTIATSAVFSFNFNYKN